MTRPLFQGEAKLVPFHFQMNDLHQKFKLNFDIQLFRMIIFFIDRLASYNLLRQETAEKSNPWSLIYTRIFSQTVILCQRSEE